MKKILTLLLVLTVVISISIVPTMAAESVEDVNANIYISGDYSYTLDDEGNASLNEYFGSTALKELLVPNTIDGHTVTRLNCFGEIDISIEKIVVPDTVTTIGSNAFYHNNSSEYVILPEGLKTIEAGAFMECFNLKSITIPDSVTYIGYNAFDTCGSLSEVILGKGLNTIKSDTFYFCQKLKYIEIPDSITKIEGGAFARCYNLMSVSIPSSVTSIGSGAFEDCSEISSVYYSGTQNQWDEMYIGNNNDNLLHPYDSIYYNSKLVGGKYSYSFNLDNTVTFEQYYGKDTEVVIPSEIDGYIVSAIGENAFCDYTDFVKSIHIPETVNRLEGNPFAFCGISKDGLNSITVDSNNQYFRSENGILYNSDKTKLICYPKGKTDTVYNLPKTVKVIGEKAFELAKNLNTIYIYDRLEKVENEAFDQCYGLKDVYYYGSRERWDLTDISPVDNDALTDAQLNFITDPLLIRGDVDEDGFISIMDATCIQKYLAEIDTTPLKYETADANKDGRIDIIDVTYIQKVIAQII